jgi:hypothetical protein
VLKTASHEHCNKATLSPLSFITIFPSTLRFFQVASPPETYPNTILYAFVTLQCLRYENSKGREWCQTEYSQVKTAWFVVRQREGVWGKTPHGIRTGQIPSLASIWQTIFLRVICDVIGVALFTDLCDDLTLASEQPTTIYHAS